MLEVLLGLSMITIVLLVIFQLFPVSDRSVGLADRTTHANYLARELMERHLEMPYETLPTSPVNGNSSLVSHTKRRGSELSTDFTYEVTVTPHPDIDNLKTIVVTVRWREGAANFERPGFVRLESVRGNLW